ncbi:MAG: Erythromycin biosynthesis sensory transduction protein eryC1, partial [uncultured bacterium]
MPVPFLDLKKQYASIKSEIDAAVMGVIEECNFIMGPNVAAFEKELAGYLEAPHAVACASGSDALLLALMAVGIK